MVGDDVTERWPGWERDLYTRWSPSGKPWIHFYLGNSGYAVADKESGHIKVMCNGNEHPHPLPKWLIIA